MTEALAYCTYRQYLWRGGKPCGVEALTPDMAKVAPLSYKIIADPYQSRLSIEKYVQGRFQAMPYDSILLDFRKLKPAEQMGWQKEMIGTNLSLIRNLDDRAVLMESYEFEGSFCRKSILKSPHGLILGSQRIFYTALGDSINGVVLYDLEGFPVMYKLYELGDEGQFTELIEEEWDMSKESTLSFLAQLSH